MSPITKCLNYRRELLIVGRVLLLGVIQFFTKVSNRIPFLLGVIQSDVSHATSKILERIGRRITGALTILALISTNALAAALDHANSFF